MASLKFLMGLFIDNFLKFTKSYLINNYMITRHRESLGPSLEMTVFFPFFIGYFLPFVNDFFFQIRFILLHLFPGFPCRISFARE